MILSVPTFFIIVLSTLVGGMVGYILRGKLEYEHGYDKGKLDGLHEVLCQLAFHE